MKRTRTYWVVTTAQPIKDGSHFFIDCSAFASKEAAEKYAKQFHTTFIDKRDLPIDKD